MSNKRSDLQGIRGLAIIAVLLFHFFPAWFPNGYIGVDQFFVLSGFLISMILSKSDLTLAALHQFYYRRVKRIVPLYLFLLLIILLAVPICYPATTNVAINIESGWHALTFTTNIAGTSPDKAYAMMLSQAEDVFTHTWSLAVEMQFYLLVPFIFFVLKKTHAGATLAVTGSLSIAFYLLAAENVAFNSVFARLWQFAVGICAQQLTSTTPREPVSEKYLPLLCEEIDGEGKVGVEAQFEPVADSRSFRLSILAHSLLALSLCLVFCPYTMPKAALRLSITFFSGAIIVLSHEVDMCALSDKFLVYMGDISYALYLAHWPLYVYCKLQYPNDNTALIATLIMSVLAGIVLTETFEKFYLRLEKPWIFFMITFFYICNLAVINNSMLLSDHFSHTKELNTLTDTLTGNETSTGGLRQFANLTDDQVVSLNTFWSQNDNKQLNYKDCSYREEWKGLPYGWCDLKTANESAAESLLVVGNSYGANFIGTIHKACKDVVKQMKLYWYTTCEPILETNHSNCGGWLDKFVKAVEETKPDHLFIIVRWMNLQLPINGTVEEDEFYQKALAGLNRLVPHVKKSIHILDSLPRLKWSMAATVNEHLRLGTRPVMEDMMDDDPTSEYQAGRKRISALLSACPKCRSIDLMPYFMENGKFSMFDETTGLVYFTSSMHMTPLALDRVQPIFNRACIDMTA